MEDIIVEKTPDELEKEKSENKGKVKKAFEQNVENIKKVLGQPLSKKKRKLDASSDMFDEMVSDLFKEEDEQLQKDLKAELKELIGNYIKLYEELDKKQKEIENLEQTKMKEFNEAAGKLWRKVENLPLRMKRVADGLKKAAEASEEGKEKGVTTP